MVSHHSAETEAGFLHRGLERAFQGQDWIKTLVYADHWIQSAPFLARRRSVLPLKKLEKFRFPSRADDSSYYARVVESFLTSFVRDESCRFIGAETLVHYVLRDRDVFWTLELVSVFGFDQLFEIRSVALT